MDNKKLWVLFSVVTLIFGTIFLTAQQILRLGANDPQYAMVKDGVARIKATQNGYAAQSGEMIDIKVSESPFMAVLDQEKRLVVSNARIDSTNQDIPLPPKAVFDDAKSKGVRTFTWQDSEGRRFATMVEHVALENSGADFYVLGAKSLKSVESRISRIGWKVFLGYLLTLAALAWYFMSKGELRVKKTVVNKK